MRMSIKRRIILTDSHRQKQDLEMLARPVWAVLMLRGFVSASSSLEIRTLEPMSTLYYHAYYELRAHPVSQYSVLWSQE